MMGIYIIQNDKFSYVNPRYAEIFGYSQTEMLLLPSAFEVVVNEDRALMQENIRQRLAGRTQGIQYRAHGLRKDGNSITVEIHGIRTELNGKAAVIGTLQDVTERERDESALQRTKEQLQSLSRRLLELQEAERRHIARELHDEIGQALTALKINLQALQRLPDTTSFVPRLVDSINIVDRTLRQVRALSLNLRPSMLDDLGLGAALRWYADQQAQRAGLHIQFLAEPLEERLEPTLETTCFRIAQEALTNIVRHAKAQSIAVELRHEQGLLHLMVRDDGIGFDLQAVQRHLIDGVASMGLLGMEERASLIGGRIELKSGSGEGTEVHAWFPLVYSVPEQAHSADLAVQ
jgi:PAS domain S-box-containing protein